MKHWKLFTPYERDVLNNFAHQIEKGDGLSQKQQVWLLQMTDKAERIAEVEAPGRTNQKARGTAKSA